MPSWLWVVIGVAVAAGVTAAVVAGISAWNRAVRNYFLRLMSRREEARNIRRAFEGLVTQVRSIEEQKTAFADDAEAVERRSLAELRDRSHQLAQELNTVALPKRLWSVAEALADACDILGEEAGRVGDEVTGDAALEALDAIDLARVGSAFAYSDLRFAETSEDVGVEDSETFAGGLYH